MPSGRPGLPSTERSAGAVRELHRGHGGRLSRPPPRRPFQIVGNRISALALSGTRARYDSVISRDESERAFGADHEVREDIEGILEIHQRVEAVAGGVLHPELVTDARGKRRVARAARPSASSAPEARSMPRGTGAGSRGPACRARCRRPGSRGSPCERTVAVLGRAAAHAACVVRGDAADHRGVDRRGVGADLAPEGRELAVGGRADDARLQTDERALVGDSERRQLSPSSTKTESLTAWPDRLVPAARKVTGARWRAHSASICATSSSIRPRPRAGESAGRSSHRCPRSSAARGR